MEFNPEQQPVMVAIDATKCQSLVEMGMLLNALGMGMTVEYAQANNLEHLLVQ